MTPVLAVRRRMHGPLWTAERGRHRVQLWAPNAKREHWALAWLVTDDDDEIADQGYLQAESYAEFPAHVPRSVAKLVGATINAATLWNPSEACDHRRAASAGLLDDGRYVCGYCGQIFDGPFPVPCDS